MRDKANPGRVELLEQLIADYAEHCSWRCEYQSRYPWEPDCHCGLTDGLRRAGLPPEWGALSDDPDSRTPPEWGPLANPDAKT